MDKVVALVSVVQTPQQDSALFAQAQRELQQLQRSPDGWDLAKALLSVPDTNTQFIGAQTFLVQLNDRTYLPAVTEMKLDLLSCLQHAVRLGYSAFVVRKLLAGIAKLYLSLGPGNWPECISGVTECLSPRLALEFFQIMIEDSELDPVQLKLSLQAAFPAIIHALEHGLQSEEGIKVLCLYATHYFEEFKQELPRLLNLLEDEALAPDAAPAVRDLYVLHRRSWPLPLKRHLAEAFMRVHMVVDYVDDERFVAMAELIIDVCQEDFTEFTAQHSFLIELACSAYPVVEDPLAFPVLGFWNQYVDEVISSGMNSSAKEIIGPVISSYWPRIRLYDSLKPSDYNEFHAFRLEFADFLELSYQLVGSELFEHLTSVVLNSIAAPDWFSIESALFCLNSLSELIGEDYKGDRPEFGSIRLLFQSNLWLILPQCRHAKVRQTAVAVIGCYVEFFQTPEGRPFLATTLNFLFSSLGNTSLQPSASRSILKLCRNCRAQLTNEVPAFLAVYAQLRDVLEPVCHERTVCGIGCVVEAISDLSARTQAVGQLIELVITSNYAEDPVQARLKCLAAVGKSQQSDETATSGQILEFQEFFRADADAQAVHARLEAIIGSTLLVNDVGVVEATCELLKTGIPEPAGLFVFGNAFIMSYISQKFGVAGPESQNPLLDLARFLISTQLAGVRSKTASGLDIDDLCSLVGLACAAADVSAAVDLLTEILKTVLFANAPLSLVGLDEAARRIVVPALESSDRFTLRSASAFLKELLSSRNELPDDLTESTVRMIVSLISGNASRSDLLNVVELFKLLISRHQRECSPWLRKFIVETPINAELTRVDTKTRAEFVAKVFLLNGARRTHSVVQNFWQQCRGIPESYTPI